MPLLITRRAALTMPIVAFPGFLSSQTWAATGRSSVEMRLRELEARSGGRLGVAVLNTATGQVLGNRLDERFAMCSTFKTLAVAYVLARVDRGEEKLERRIFFTERDLVKPFKATKPYLVDGMIVEQLCEVAITVSDSTAANLLLASFGGPSKLTTYLRSLGDPVTHLDEIELDLNIVKPGESHDTTSPRAMVGTLRRIILGDVLSAPSRMKLTAWMIASKDAATRRLRAGLPEGWRIANKPGTWDGISTNDIGVIFPPSRDPIVIAAYLGEATGETGDQEVILSDVARIVAEEI